MKFNFKLSDETRTRLQEIAAALTQQYPRLATAGVENLAVESRGGCDCGGGCRGSCSGRCGGCGGNCKGAAAICTYVI
jgi:hypothetical protein